MNETRFERDAFNGIRLHVLPTDRYKTTTISVFVGHVLDERTVTPIALIPFVLRRGTSAHPETKAFRAALDDMYGAGFSFDIYKRGDYQIVNFRLDVIRDEFASSGISLLRRGVGFIGEVLTSPAMENGRFLEKYVEAEKHTVEKRIEALINDKTRYAAERCVEEMCKDEPYRLHPLGRKDQLPPLTPEDLTGHYREWLGRSPVDVYVVGDTTLEEVRPLVERAFAIERNGPPEDYATRAPAPAPEEVRTVVERLDVNQGKLNLGLRTAASYAKPNYAAALVYNGVLGGFPHSKLFLNVREKASLAYYAYSRLDGHKGILTVSTGIEIGNYDQAVAIIQDQLEAMKEGRISDLEMKQTKAMIVNHLRELNDSPLETILFDFNSVLSGRERSAATLAEEVERIAVGDVVGFAETVRLDTIYFLRDREEDRRP